MRTERFPTIYVELFTGVADIVERLATTDREPDANDESESDNDGWAGGSYDEATEYLSRGWVDGARRSAELSAELGASFPVGSRARFTLAPVGVLPDVPAFLSGEPRHMYSPVRRDVRKPRHLTLLIPASYNSGVPARAAENRALAFVALVDALENVDIRTRLLVHRATALPGDRRYSSVLTLKESSEHLVLSDVAFTLGHPAFLRRIGFALEERSTYAPMITATNNGYGRAIPLNGADIGEPDAVTFTMITDRNARTPKQYLADILAELPDDIRRYLVAD